MALDEHVKDPASSGERALQWRRRGVCASLAAVACLCGSMGCLQDIKNPRVRIIQPAEGAEICSPVGMIEVEAIDESGVASVVIYVEGQQVARLDAEPWQFECLAGPCLAESGTEVHIRVVATDEEDNEGEHAIDVRIGPVGPGGC